jgi:prophage regulatory protein
VIEAALLRVTVQDVTTLTAVRLDLVGRAELLQMLGISPTRLVQITTRPEYSFPDPVAELIGGKIWLLADVKAWAERQGRKLNEMPAK